MRLEFKGELIYFGVGAVLLTLVASGCIPMEGTFPPPLITSEPVATRSKDERATTASKEVPRPTAEEEKVVAIMEAAASRANDAALRANAAAKKPEAAASRANDAALRANAAAEKPEAAAMKAETAAEIAAAAAAEAKKAAKEAQAALKKAFLILMFLGR